MSVIMRHEVVSRISSDGTGHCRLQAKVYNLHKYVRYDRIGS
jgi:hypothetical protein